MQTILTGFEIRVIIFYSIGV